MMHFLVTHGNDTNGSESNLYSNDVVSVEGEKTLKDALCQALATGGETKISVDGICPTDSFNSI